MTTPIDYHVFYALEYIGGGMDTAQIFYAPNLQGYHGAYVVSVNGVGIRPGDPDEPNEIFDNIEDAIEHYKVVQTNVSLTNLNGDTGRDYVLNNLVYLPPQMQDAAEAIYTALAGKQATITPGAAIADAVDEADAVIKLNLLLATLEAQGLLTA